MRSRLSSHPETIEEYSDALRQRLAGTIPPEKIEEVIAETQAHLEDSAAELRYQADVYERHAVTNFVPVSKLSRGITRAWAPIFLRHSGTKPLQNISMAVSLLGVCWLLAAMLAHSKLPSWVILPHFLPEFLLLVPLSVFVLALFACRPQLRRFALGGVATITVCFLLGGFLCTEKGIFISRFDAPAHYKDNLAAYDFRNEEIRVLRSGLLALAQNYTPTEWTHLSSEQRNAKLLEKARLQKEFYQPATSIEKAQLKRQLANYERFAKSSELSHREWRLEKDGFKIALKTIKMKLQELERLPEVSEANHRTKQLAMLPASLRLGTDSVLMPQTHQEPTSGLTAFHDGSELPIKSYRMETQTQAQIAAIQATPPLSTTDLQKASQAWQKDGPIFLSDFERYQVWNKKERRGILKLMTRPQGSFEWEAARLLGLAGAGAVGCLLVADLLGGYAGMALLKLQRRRRTRQIGLGA